MDSQDDTNFQESQLNPYFKNKRIRRHLIEAGLINRHGDVLPPSSYKAIVSRRPKHRQNKAAISHAIVNYVIEEDRKRQAFIRNQFELALKRFQVLKIKESNYKNYRSLSNSLAQFSKNPQVTNHQTPSTKHRKVSSKRTQSAHYPPVNVKNYVNQRPTSVKQPEFNDSYVSMIYYGSSKVPENKTNRVRPPVDEVVVMQQHCGGENLMVFRGLVKPNETFTFQSHRHIDYPFAIAMYINGLVDSRISVCCEYKHKHNIRLGGKCGLFGIWNVQKSQPCRKCRLERRMKNLTSESPKVVSRSPYQKSVVPRRSFTLEPSAGNLLQTPKSSPSRFDRSQSSSSSSSSSTDDDKDDRPGSKQKISTSPLFKLDKKDSSSVSSKSDRLPPFSLDKRPDSSQITKKLDNRSRRSSSSSSSSSLSSSNDSELKKRFPTIISNKNTHLHEPTPKTNENQHETLSDNSSDSQPKYKTLNNLVTTNKLNPQSRPSSSSSSSSTTTIKSSNKKYLTELNEYKNQSLTKLKRQNRVSSSSSSDTIRSSESISKTNEKQRKLSSNNNPNDQNQSRPTSSSIKSSNKSFQRKFDEHKNESSPMIQHQNRLSSSSSSESIQSHELILKTNSKQRETSSNIFDKNDNKSNSLKRSKKSSTSSSSSTINSDIRAKQINKDPIYDKNKSIPSSIVNVKENSRSNDLLNKKPVTDEFFLSSSDETLKKLGSTSEDNSFYDGNNNKSSKTFNEQLFSKKETSRPPSRISKRSDLSFDNQPTNEPNIDNNLSNDSFFEQLLSNNKTVPQRLSISSTDDQLLNDSNYQKPRKINRQLIDDDDLFKITQKTK